MVGYTRAKTMQKPAVTKLLHRPLTWAESSNQVREVLSIVEKRQIDILYYEEDGKYRNYSLTRSSLFFGSFRYSCSRTATTSMLTFLAAFSSTTRARWVRPSSCETETLDVCSFKRRHFVLFRLPFAFYSSFWPLVSPVALVSILCRENEGFFKMWSLRFKTIRSPTVEVGRREWEMVNGRVAATEQEFFFLCPASLSKQKSAPL